MKLNVLRADPAGNITLFVLDPIERERRAALAAELMRRLPDMQIDQVGFACQMCIRDSARTTPAGWK